MARLNVWTHLKKKAIDAVGVEPSAESAADDDTGFAEDLGVEEDAPQPAKKKARRRIRGLDFVEVEVVRRPGSGTTSTRTIIFENKAGLCMDVGEGLQSLEWLVAAVQLEIHDPGAVSVVHAVPQPSSPSTPSLSQAVATPPAGRDGRTPQKHF